MKTAIEQIRAALEQGERLTGLDAFNRFGIHHLASTIRRLKEKGVLVEVDMVKLPNGKQIARYHMPCTSPVDMARIEGTPPGGVRGGSKGTAPFPV